MTNEDANPGGADLGAVIGALRHSHLLNTYQRLPAPHLRDAMNNGSSSFMEVQCLIDTIASNLGTSLDPARLIAECNYLKWLDPRTRASMQATLHGVYEEEFRPGAVRRAIEDAGEEFRVAAAEFLASDNHGERDALERLRGAARRLGSLLSALPRCVWLPQ